MRLTGKLEEKVSKLETEQEVRDAILEAGIELDDEEFEKVVGGFRQLPSAPVYKCEKCGIIPADKVIKSGKDLICANCTCKVTYTNRAASFR